MKKINVFDTFKVIKYHDGFIDFDEELLEKLDELLNQIGVAHAFSECRTEDIEKDENSVVIVMYNGEDDTKFFLAYALFIRTYRNATDEMIDEAMKKHLNK